MNWTSNLSGLRGRLVLWSLLLLPMAAFGTYGLIDLIGERPLDRGLVVADTPAALHATAPRPTDGAATTATGLSPSEEEQAKQDAVFVPPSPTF